MRFRKWPFVILETRTDTPEPFVWGPYKTFDAAQDAERKLKVMANADHRQVTKTFRILELKEGFQ